MYIIQYLLSIDTGQITMYIYTEFLDSSLYTKLWSMAQDWWYKKYMDIFWFTKVSPHVYGIAMICLWVIQNMNERAYITTPWILCSIYCFLFSSHAWINKKSFINYIQALLKLPRYFTESLGHTLMIKFWICLYLGYFWDHIALVPACTGPRWPLLLCCHNE